ncbi:MAG: Phosphoribosylformylglycinamidine synthase, PurS subunit, partial [uncultured Rubrobacteraceae bacterium]
ARQTRSPKPDARYLEDPRPRPSQGGNTRPAGRGRAGGASGPGVPGCEDRPCWAPDRDGGRERGRGGRDVPAPALEPDHRGVPVGGGLV